MDRIYALVILALSATACAAPAPKVLRQSDIVVLAKNASKGYCAGTGNFGYTRTGCEFDVLFEHNAWSVIARPIQRNAHGEIMQAMGSHRLYIFSPSGKLLRELQGR